MPISLTYPHTASGEPRPLRPQQIWMLASQVRRQLLDDPAARLLDLDDVVERAAEFVVNGVPYSAWWDLDHPVTKSCGTPVMGSTDFDPAAPDGVMVSVNGRELGGRDDLMRSTAAHELGHVVFDAPAWIRAATVASASWEDTTAHLPSPLGGGEARLREFRANEFMGALLAPATLIKVEFLRFAKRYRLPASAHPSEVLRGAPAFDGWACEEDAISEALVSLAERFGISESFVRVRLDRYDLLRTGRLHDVA
jgi:hypothetical protein